MSRPALASITLSPEGGGIAAVSRLVWHVFQDTWGPDCSLIEMRGSPSFNADPPGMLARVGFGSRTLAAQMFGGCSWVLFGHTALTKAQTLVPPPFRRPYAVWLYGIESWRAFDGWQERAVAGARLRIAISRFTARQAARLHPGIGPIVECPLGLAVAPPPLRSSGTGPPTVLIVGRMLSAERYKGHDELLEAWPRIIAGCHDARLVVVGDGDDRPRLEGKAAALGLASSVRFTGFVSTARLREHYADAWVFAMPSRGEGFGLVYLEAMSHGLPCIGSIHDAAGEVIDDGITGFLVDQSDIGGIADRIVRLLTDPGLRVQMGCRSQERLQAHFTYECFRARLLSLIEPAFGMPPTARGRVDGPVHRVA